jgi:RNA polymerase sigma-70 factor (ECF subfamily)
VNQDELYKEAAGAYGPALIRLARGYEADADKRRDLLQEIHLALWRSFDKFQGRCSLRTWVYRIAHTSAMLYVFRQHRKNMPVLMDLADLEALPVAGDVAKRTEDRLVLDRLMELIHRLKPLDRQLMLLYLEDMDAAAIGEITGMTAGGVRTQIHRIKAILARRFHGGREDVE